MVGTQVADIAAHIAPQANATRHFRLMGGNKKTKGGSVEAKVMIVYESSMTDA